MRARSATLAPFALLSAALLFTARPGRASAQDADVAIEGDAEVTATGEAEAEVDVAVEPAAQSDVSVEAQVEPRQQPVEVVTAPGDGGLDDAEIARQLRQRAEIATIHRAFGITTWVSMAITAVLGFIQFYDEYGWHGNPNETACATGRAVFQDYCTGFPLPHAIAALTTSALYFTTFGLSFAMPSPTERSADVELHRTLRWFHLATMIATAVFGGITANLEVDFQTRQALAAVHQGLAITTFGLLTVAAGVIIF